MGRMPPDIGQRFLGQAKACRDLGSPFTARLCELLAERLDDTSRFARRVFDWPPQTALNDAMALRAVAGFHALARSGQAPMLAAVYPPHDAGDDELWQAIQATIHQHDAFLHDYLDGPPQTNEVSRSGVLLGGALIVAAETGLPLAWHEIGASMGLNLGFDGYRYDLGAATWGEERAPVHIRCEWRGHLPPLDADLRVVTRAGCDVNPLDAADAADRERMLTYIWADQAERLNRIEAAIAATAAASVHVEKADAGDWLARRLTTFPAQGCAVVIAHTIMWQYLPKAVQKRIAGLIAQAGEKASRAAPLAWLRLESDGETQSAVILLTSWPGGREREIGRASFHGYWAEWAAR